MCKGTSSGADGEVRSLHAEKVEVAELQALSELLSCCYRNISES